MIPTVLFSIAIYKQFGIVATSPKGDPYIVSKVAFLVFNLCIVAGYWFLIYNNFMGGLFFFIVPGMISVWTYVMGRKRKPPVLPLK